MTLRPGSRDYYYQKLDAHFPGVKEKYIQAFGGSYQCSAPNWQELNAIFVEEMNTAGMAMRIPIFEARKKVQGNSQLTLFED
jgi:hypothetical protein